MEKTIGKVIVPAIGFGTFMLTGKKCRESVADALEIGYRHIDTARNYNNEVEIGKAIRDSGIPRAHLFLTSKVESSNLNYDQVLLSAEESLSSLNMDYMDLLLIHWPSTEGVPLHETIRGFKMLQEQGKIRFYGVSNFTPELLKEALVYGEISCNQVEYHPFLKQDALLKICKQHDIILTAYSPLARGKINMHEKIRDIASKYNKTPAQITLRWLIQQELVITIPKAASHDHRKENFDVFDFELKAADMDQLFSIERTERIFDPQTAPWNQ